MSTFTNESLQSMRRIVLKVLLLAVILLAFSLPRLLELDRYVTPDEPKWLMRSANFYQALSQHSLKDTYQHEHPGVTTTMAGMLGFLRCYPCYVDIRPGQIERPEKLSIFLRNRDISPLRLLEAGRIVMVLANTLVFGLAYLAAWRLLGWVPATIGALLLAFDPFYVALSRLLHVDGLMTTLILLSLLAFLCYQYCGRRLRYLVLSGIAAGLSWLTKSPAFFLAPFIGLVVLADRLNTRHWVHRTPSAPDRPHPWLLDLWSMLAPALLWFTVAAAIFILLWPAMWVDPLGTLGHVFSQARIYAIEGHENATFFNGQIYAPGESVWYFYPISFLWRTSPPILIGLGLALLAVAFPRRLDLPTNQRRAILFLGSFAFLFIIFMSLGAKKFDRYLLPVHVTLDLVAALGWVSAIKTAQHRLGSRVKEDSLRWGAFAAYSLIIVVQISGVLQTFPYYFNYYNSMLGGSRKALDVMMIGWGEGLDQAAAYLNSQPSAEQIIVVAWYGDGPFSFIFNGKTISMDVTDSLNDLQKANYAVVYLNQWQRQLPSPEVLGYFARRAPDFVARIGELEYAWVYQMQGSLTRGRDKTQPKIYLLRGSK